MYPKKPSRQFKYTIKVKIYILNVEKINSYLLLNNNKIKLTIITNIFIITNI